MGGWLAGLIENKTNLSSQLGLGLRWELSLAIADLSLKTKYSIISKLIKLHYKQSGIIFWKFTFFSYPPLPSPIVELQSFYPSLTHLYWKVKVVAEQWYKFWPCSGRIKGKLAAMWSIFLVIVPYFPLKILNSC